MEQNVLKRVEKVENYLTQRMRQKIRLKAKGKNFRSYLEKAPDHEIITGVILVHLEQIALCLYSSVIEESKVSGIGDSEKRNRAIYFASEVLKKMATTGEAITSFPEVKYDLGDMRSA